MVRCYQPRDTSLSPALTFFSVGNALQDLFTDQDLEQLVTRVSSVDVLNPSLFDDLKDKAFEVMLTEHFAEFQKSEQNQSFEKWLEAKKEKRKKSTEYLKSRQRKINVRTQSIQDKEI